DVVARPIAVLPLADGRLLIVDRGDDPGLFVVTMGGVRAPVAAAAEHCQSAMALCRDDQGRIYVLDQRGERVQRFTPALQFDAVVVDLAEHLDDYPPTEPIS